MEKAMEKVLEFDGGQVLDIIGHSKNSIICEDRDLGINVRIGKNLENEYYTVEGGDIVLLKSFDIKMNKLEKRDWNSYCEKYRVDVEITNASEKMLVGDLNNKESIDNIVVSEIIQCRR